MAKGNLKVVPESHDAADRNVYIVSIGPTGFAIQFAPDDEYEVLTDARSIIIAAARDLMGCIRKAGPDARLDDTPNLGVELLIGLAAALDSEVRSRDWR